MSTMVEKVARAIYETEPYGISATKEMSWLDVHESQKEGFRVKARAAIEAMKEPTLEMLSEEICTQLERDLDHMTPMGSLNMAYMSMIDAALKEEGQ